MRVDPQLQLLLGSTAFDAVMFAYFLKFLHLIFVLQEDIMIRTCGNPHGLCIGFFLFANPFFGLWVHIQFDDVTIVIDFIVIVYVVIHHTIDVLIVDVRVDCYIDIVGNDVILRWLLWLWLHVMDEFECKLSCDEDCVFYYTMYIFLYLFIND
jgi:hypothetical protein